MLDALADGAVELVHLAAGAAAERAVHLAAGAAAERAVVCYVLGALAAAKAKAKGVYFAAGAALMTLSSVGRVLNSRRRH